MVQSDAYFTSKLSDPANSLICPDAWRQQESEWKFDEWAQSPWPLPAGSSIMSLDYQRIWVVVYGPVYRGASLSGADSLACSFFNITYSNQLLSPLSVFLSIPKLKTYLFLQSYPP